MRTHLILCDLEPHFIQLWPLALEIEVGPEATDDRQVNALAATIGHNGGSHGEVAGCGALFSTQFLKGST